MSHPVIIIGSGLAGCNVARELRKLDAAVPLVVVSRDHAVSIRNPCCRTRWLARKPPPHW